MKRLFELSAGASQVEYAIMVGVISIVVIASVGCVGDWVSRNFESTSNAFGQSLGVSHAETTETTLATTPGGTYGDPDPDYSGPVRISGRVPR